MDDGTIKRIGKLSEDGKFEPFGATKTWNCSKCGKSEIESNFCPDCGTKKPESLVWTCPNCGKQDIESKFCPDCGTKKPESKIVVKEVAVVNEKKSSELEMFEKAQKARLCDSLDGREVSGKM